MNDSPEIYRPHINHELHSDEREQKENTVLK